MIEGSATAEGTSTHIRSYTGLSHGLLGRTDLTVSQAAFGGYRVDLSDPAHYEALEKAILSGVNLIDTSSNYTNGGSEALIGQVLRELIQSGRLKRDAVVVVTKGGYIQGQSYAISQERRARGRPFSDSIQLGEGLEHCIHPEFLAGQIGLSLDRLGLETVDAYLLHNPEYYLTWAQEAGLALSEARSEYYRRIKLAFEHLETEVEKGRLRSYGLSSNTMPLPSEEYEFTSLERVWEIAQSISPTHHFRVVQLPLNLLETGAVTEKNLSGGRSVLEFAEDNRLGVLTNRPLNAIIGTRLIRLAEAGPVRPFSKPEIVRRIMDLLDSESFLTDSLLAALKLPPSIAERLIRNAALGKVLLENWEKFQTLAQWQSVKANYFIPRINEVVQFMATLEDSPAELSTWMKSHVDTAQKAFEAVESRYLAHRAARSDALRGRVAGLDPEWAAAGTLSRMALRAVRSTPGVTAVLAGARRHTYVEEVVTEISVPTEKKDRQTAWQTLQAIRDDFKD